MERKPLRRQSKKKAAIRTRLRKMKISIFEHSPWCTGCGYSTNNLKALDLSHIVGVGSRVDLEEVEENLTLHCRKCHTIWERGTLKEKMTLLDYKQLVEVVKKLAIDIYEKHYRPPLPKADEGDKLPF